MKKPFLLIKTLITKDRTIFLTAIIIAIAFWFYVVGVYSPETAKVIRDIPLTSTLSKINTSNTVNSINNADQTQENYMILKGIPTTVDVVVDGLRTDMGTLSNDKIKAEVDFSSITAEGEYELPVKVKLPSQYTLVSVTPAVVKVHISKKITVGIEVIATATGKVKEGFALESVKSVPSIINVTGPEEILNTIEKAATNIDITDANDVVEKKANFVFYGPNNSVIDTTNLIVDGNQVLVTANVFKSKKVPFVATVVNSSGGSDDKFSTVTISPKEIEIVGSSSVIDSLNSIDLGVLDMADAVSAGKTFTIDIIIPNGVKALTPVTKATVTVAYPELSTKKIVISKFEFTGANGPRASLPNGFDITINVRGIASDLAALDANTIIGKIAIPDVMATGKSQLPITFSLPSESKTSVVGKYNTMVNIK